MITTCTSPSDILKQNRVTEHVFNRFNINARSVEKITVNTALKEINPNFLVDVLNVFCSYKKPTIEQFNSYPLPIILDYLTRSHTYYSEKIVPEIGQSITQLLHNYDKEHPLLEILYKFYFKYKVDIEAHFKDEESGIFSYGSNLYKAVFFKKNCSFFIDFLQQNSIKDFVDTHASTTEDLANITKILIQYSPPKTNETSYRILLEQLKNFAQDLEIHAFIEDKVLINKLYELEQQIKLESSN